MSSPALDKFEGEIQALSLSVDVRDQIMTLTEAFYCGVIREEANHIERHLDAVVAEYPEDLEMLARATLIKGWLAKIRKEDLHAALTLQAGLEGEPLV